MLLISRAETSRSVSQKQEEQEEEQQVFEDLVPNPSYLNRAAFFLAEQYKAPLNFEFFTSADVIHRFLSDKALKGRAGLRVRIKDGESSFLDLTLVFPKIDQRLIKKILIRSKNFLISTYEKERDLVSAPVVEEKPYWRDFQRDVLNVDIEQFFCFSTFCSGYVGMGFVFSTEDNTLGLRVGGGKKFKETWAFFSFVLMEKTKYLYFDTVFKELFSVSFSLAALATKNRIKSTFIFDLMKLTRSTEKFGLLLLVDLSLSQTFKYGLGFTLVFFRQIYLSFLFKSPLSTGGSLELELGFAPEQSVFQSGTTYKKPTKFYTD